MYFQQSKFGAAILALAIAVAGCAGRGKDWPSLMTPEEQRTGKPAGAPALLPAVAAVDPPVAAPSPPPPKLSDGGATELIRAQASRLSEARRDAGYISERRRQQQAKLAATGAGIKQKGPGDAQWNKAQLELTKLNQIAAEWDDLESIVNRAAGQLAIAAHQGNEVTSALAEAGALLVQIAAAKTEAARERSAVRQKFSL
jgi:hypothetical protein